MGHWPRTIAADDGTTVVVRPILPDDGPALETFHDALSERTQVRRFHGAKPHLSPSEVDRLTHVDYVDRMALVALDGEAIAGVARYERTDAASAEVAFVLADRFQGHGLGPQLCRMLAETAVAAGIREFTASVATGNTRMLGAFRAAGFDIAQRLVDGVVEVRFPIP